MTTHGDTQNYKHAFEYDVWMLMRQRCTNMNIPSYKNYGARGIKVCDKWMYDYAAFLKDVGRCPPECCSIDRINNDGDYEPGNVRWVSRAQQSRNKRNNRLLTFRGKTQCVVDWELELGFSKGLVTSRLSRGWPADVALSISSDSMLPPNELEIWVNYQKSIS